MNRFAETLYDSYGQEFRVDELLYEDKTDHQHLVIFHNAAFGRVMALDGVIQTTEKDEFIYHEMLVHVPLIAHGGAGRVLIIGGGDGAALREVAKHRQVDEIVMVEIDSGVIDVCRKYLPGHSAGAFDDPRLELVIEDGLEYVTRTDAKFDVIITDSTDPIGPGESLFGERFYRACHGRLLPGGVLATQNGVCFMQLEEAAATARRFRSIYTDWHFYSAAVPTYVGGIMVFGWASDDPQLRRLTRAEIGRRYLQSGIETRYYTPEIHRAAFALPRYLLEAIGKACNAAC